MRSATFRLAATLGLACLMTSCGLSVAGYVKKAQEERMYSMMRGRITRIQDLSTDKIEYLRDGLAVTLNQPGEVMLRSSDEDTALFHLEAGNIIVHGRKSDYILHSSVISDEDEDETPEADVTAGTSDESGEATGASSSTDN